MLIARLLGAEDLGRYSYGVALVGLFTVLFDFGILPVAVHSLSRQPSSSALRTFATLKFATTIVGLVLLGVAVMLSKISLADAWIAFGIGVYLGLNDLATFVVATYRAQGEFWRETLYRSVTAVAQLVLCLFAILLTHELKVIVAVLIVAALVGMIPLLAETARHPSGEGIPMGWHGIATAAYRCFPLAGSILVTSVYMNLDIVILARHVSLEEVGWYGVAVKAIFGLLIVPLPYLLSASFPALASEMMSNPPEVMRARWLRGFVLSSMAGAILCLATALIASQLLRTLFGAGYVPASPLLVVFCLIGFLFYLYTPLSQWLLQQGQQKFTFYIQCGAIVVNFLTVPLFISLWGLWGAVAAAFATHLSIAASHAVVVFRGTSFNRADLWALVRISLAITNSIALLYFEIGGPSLSKLLAVIAFFAVSHREALTMFNYLRSVNQKLISGGPTA